MIQPASLHSAKQRAPVGIPLLLLLAAVSVFGKLSARRDDVKPAQMLKPSLTIEASIYYGAEDEEKTPVAATAFYLLDASLIKILRRSNFAVDAAFKPIAEQTDEDFLAAAAASFYSEDEEQILINLLVKKEIAAHRSYELQTDAAGRATTKTIVPGVYYLFGIGKTENEMLVWHFPVAVRSGSNRITIDQHNAGIVLSR